ncbi:MAG: amidohydrolase, partial [Eubacterium sp.]|nr:amidohydrolase [Eubacterium sp.]
MKIRFYNARIMTMENGVEIQKGELHTQEDRVAYVGPAREEKETFDREIDCQNNLLMPGFKNAHTHSSMTFLRSYADDLPLLDWLHKQVFPMEAKLTYEDQIVLTKLAIMEYLTSGITANFDMYKNSMAHAEASVQCGFRTVMTDAMNDYGGDANEVKEVYAKVNAYDPLVSYTYGFHAEYTTSRKLMEELAQAAREAKVPVYLHVSETRDEVQGCMDRYGLPPIEFLDSIGMFEYGGGGYHGVWLTEKEMEICAKKNISIITNPCSNVKLASGIADLCKLQEKGVNLAIGTDGPASNNALDMFREMYLAATLQKVKHMDAAAMDAASVLRMATVGGSIAMGLTECDTLAVGKKADLIMIDMMRPNMQPE